MLDWGEGGCWEKKIKVTPGIRQGYKLITYVIIEKLTREGAFCRMYEINLNLL